MRNITELNVADRKFGGFACESTAASGTSANTSLQVAGREPAGAQRVEAATSLRAAMGGTNDQQSVRTRNQFLRDDSEGR